MKRIMALACALSLFGLVFISCDDEEKTVPSPEIAVLLKNPSNSWRSALGYYSRNSLDQMGIQYLVETAATGVEQGERLHEIGENIKPRVLIVIPEGGLIADSVNYVIKQNIPLILGEQIPTGVEGHAAAVVFDNNLVGEEAANFINGKASKKVLVMNVRQDPTTSNARLSAFESKLKELNPTVELDTIEIERYTRDNGKNGMAAAFKESTEYDAVFAQDDEIALGVLDAIKAADDKDINVRVVVGCGGAQTYLKVIQLEENIEMATTLYSPRALMEACIGIANQLLDNKQPENKMIVLSADVIDKSNVDEYLDSNSPY